MPTSEELLQQLRTLHPITIDLSLGRIERLLAALGNPHGRLPPVIHVAGTNGKGSTCAMLKAMLQASGRRVHMFTSPHLVRFHERIEVAGSDGIARPIDDALLVDALARTAKANGSHPITFFEITTAAAFLAFAEQPADALVLEVGLGGRLDATNVVKRPALSIITPVSMDHAHYLGDTVARIAREKAGILKRGVPAVVSQQPADALEVITATAHATLSPLAVWGTDFDAFEQNGRLVYQDDRALLDLPLPALMGRHQIVNAGASVAAARRLPRPLGLTEEAIGRGLREAVWPARMQRLKSGPLADLAGGGNELWLDGGHNPAGGAALAQTLADLEERVPKPLVLIAGMMAQKDSAGFFVPFRGLARRVITVGIPKVHEKAHTPDALAAVVRGAGIDAEPAVSIEAAIRRAAEIAGAGTARIVICGSLYLAGNVLAIQEGITPQLN